jgi:hypothetical protein
MTEGKEQQINTGEQEIEKYRDLNILSKQLSDELFEIAGARYNDPPVSWKEIRIREQAAIENFIESKINEKFRFQHIFRTDKGSLYFVDESGESWRIKQTEEGLRSEPVCRKIVFVTQETSQELLKKMKGMEGSDSFLNDKIPTVPLRAGVVPFEFGISHFPEIVSEDLAGSITILGTRYKDEIKPHFASGVHVGHPVTEIIL